MAVYFYPNLTPKYANPLYFLFLKMVAQKSKTLPIADFGLIQAVLIFKDSIF